MIPDTKASGIQKPPTSGPPVATAAPASMPAPQSKKFTFDQRYIPPIFITLILVVGQITFGVLESIPYTLAAIAASILMEMALGMLFYKKIPHLASAYISGISVGILIRSPFWWPYILCSAIAITSKYLIRVRGRHIWNPSNLAIAVMLVIAYDSVAPLNIQWGNSHWAMLAIWVLGSIIIYRLKRFHICATYVISFIAYALLRSLIIPHGAGETFSTLFLREVAPITGPMYQLFIFFMITDPKTTVTTKKGQILVAFLIATMENILRLTGTFTDFHFFAIHAPYYALFIVGPVANLIEIWKTPRAPGGANAPVPAK
ncbi:MAG TPA: RnfABCDGE type electron transport complex subunit D [Chthonomonadaceae bacterium]|nr:RnfABCDGE type electron transport complex subunit D [Chthonomonadaceae bacterium]